MTNPSTTLTHSPATQEPAKKGRVVVGQICVLLGHLPWSSVVFWIDEMGPIGCQYVYTYIYIYTLWLFNIAMENDPFIDDFPINTSIYKGFSMAMLNNQMVYIYIYVMYNM